MMSSAHLKFFSGRFNGIYVRKEGRRESKCEVQFLVWTCVDVCYKCLSDTKLHPENTCCVDVCENGQNSGGLEYPLKSKGSKCKARQATVGEGPVKAKCGHNRATWAASCLCELQTLQSEELDVDQPSATAIMATQVGATSGPHPGCHHPAGAPRSRDKNCCSFRSCLGIFC